MLDNVDYHTLKGFGFLFHKRALATLLMVETQFSSG